MIELMDPLRVGIFSPHPACKRELLAAEKITVFSAAAKLSLTCVALKTTSG
jgi:hypothetical protein